MANSCCVSKMANWHLGQEGLGSVTPVGSKLCTWLTSNAGPLFNPCPLWTAFSFPPSILWSSSAFPLSHAKASEHLSWPYPKKLLSPLPGPDLAFLTRETTTIEFLKADLFFLPTP